jgi:bisphosphoglycerate-dependent phosphoglycerate mutase
MQATSRRGLQLHCPMQGEDSSDQKQKTDEELAQERMSQWVKSDDAAPAAEGEADEAHADETAAEEEIEVDEEEAAEEVQCCLERL